LVCGSRPGFGHGFGFGFDFGFGAVAVVVGGDAAVGTVVVVAVRDAVGVELPHPLARRQASAPRAASLLMP
jgi:hypothetical protein